MALNYQGSEGELKLASTADDDAANDDDDDDDDGEYEEEEEEEEEEDDTDEDDDEEEEDGVNMQLPTLLESAKSPARPHEGFTRSHTSRPGVDLHSCPFLPSNSQRLLPFY